MQKWERTKSLEKEIVQKNSIIRTFETETGVFQADSVLMRQNFELKTGICKTCVPKLSKCNEDLLIYRPRAKRRGWTVAIGIPAGLLIGWTAGKLIN